MEAFKTLLSPQKALAPPQVHEGGAVTPAGQAGGLLVNLAGLELDFLLCSRHVTISME